ncbi:MAG: preprotein translocase subunit SecY [Candidatus Altiarchaeota archaeon]|nr:preprotein translocase subunit SecY [Candidatus Altiarchaeota archaeon]
MKLEFLRPAIKYLPEVKLPGRHVAFKEKIAWTSLALILFFIMGVIYPYGVTIAKLEESIRGFSQLQLIFASSMGSIVSAGIGPIVTASIILQLLAGAEMIDIDLKKPEGKALYQGTQKILTIIISFVEAGMLVTATHMVYTLVEIPGGGSDWSVSWPLRIFTILQIGLGSVLLMYLDEVVSKWGIGSGISLFIAGGVAQTIITYTINPLREASGRFAGLIPNFLDQMMIGNFDVMLLMPLFATLFVFLVVAFGESMRLEIPLSYGGIRGVGGRYPLRFFYVSNIPVILAAALLANVQMWAGFVGVDINNAPPFQEMTLVQQTVYTIASSVSLGELNGILLPDQISNLLDIQILKHMAIYLVIFLTLCVVFGQFWVSTTGLNSESIAKQIQDGGMQIPGFRRDYRIIKTVLDRYIPQITIISSVAVGLVAAGADFLGAIGSGTGLLLTVGILYRLYEEIQKEQMAGVSPWIRKMVGREE